MRAILVKSIADLRRRRVQAAVIFLTVLLSISTGTMALTLMSQTHNPYETAFAAQKGAHLQVYYSGTTDRQQLASTSGLIGATAVGGPYPSTNVSFEHGGQKFGMNMIGRDDPGGRVEQLRITAGRWPTSSDQVVLTRSFAELNNFAVGDRVKVTSVLAKPMLTVAALVVDIDQGSADLSSQHGWMLTAAVPALTTKDTSFYLMGYRFASDPTSAQLQGYVEHLRSTLPAGSITGSVNYLLIRTVFNITNQIVTSVLAAFSIFALAATAAIVANLVTGIVIAAYREIGIMKAVGFTPGQVVSVFVVQILIPGFAACVIGIPAGNILSQPLLANSSHALGLPYQPTFSIGLDLVALVGAFIVVGLAAGLPALRAGLLKPIAVLASANAPRGASGRWLRIQASRLRLPRPIVLGIGDAFARPLRGILTLLAVLLGVATVTVAIGLPRSFALINNSETGAGNYQVLVNRSSVFPDSEVMRILNAQPETTRVVAETGENIAIPGIGDAINTRIFRGDSSRLGYLVIAGRWFSAPGEVIAPRGLLHDAHLSIGDTFTATAFGKPLQLKVVGEVYDISNLGHQMFMDLSTITQISPDESVAFYRVTLRRGSDVSAYMRRVAAAEPDLLNVRASNTGIIGPVQIIDSVLLVLAIVLGLIAFGGIFNTLLLNTRERMRDTATLKAVGMSPRQVVVMVAASAGLLALIGGVVAVPSGLGLNHLLNDIISGSTGNDTPPSAYNVFNPFELIAIPILGVGVALVAALIPGRWAARTNVVEVLHSE